ncbi:hypothetical protein GCM10011519_18480 [Marmoricola endophyticus]|uniref:DUF2071 domain-containing protein n=1 Tax=Marmoricola endophyticus TaxID=2040280 RepID=A0A917BJB0_9ACTN|nr:DUF2071 domain-containing protein [Marmoricola endophyticus]GGF44941.1 hypothetical protein GCM10011519_18480 [Marmoricola endophyticus]
MSEGRLPALDGPVLMDQEWRDAAFLHWRVDPAVVAPWMPSGARVDVLDGATYVGLIGFVMHRAGFGSGRPVPFFGDFVEVNVRLYSTDAAGRKGVVFASLDAERLAVVGLAGLLGVRYRWARADARREDERLTYRSQRLAPPHRGARTDLVLRTRDEPADDALSVFLTARWCMHTQVAGRGAYVPNTHEPWPLRVAEVVRCEDGLVAAAGLGGLTARAPDSVLWSPGVRTRFGLPRWV